MTAAPTTIIADPTVSERAAAALADQPFYDTDLYPWHEWQDAIQCARDGDASEHEAMLAADADYADFLRASNADSFADFLAWRDHVLTWRNWRPFLEARAVRSGRA